MHSAAGIQAEAAVHGTFVVLDNMLLIVTDKEQKAAFSPDRQNLSALPSKNSC